MNTALPTPKKTRCAVVIVNFSATKTKTSAFSLQFALVSIQVCGVYVFPPAQNMGVYYNYQDKTTLPLDCKKQPGVYKCAQYADGKRRVVCKWHIEIMYT